MVHDMALGKISKSIGERNFTNYDYVDIAEGISTIEYHAGNLFGSGIPSTKHILSRKPFYSHDSTEGASMGATGAVIQKYYTMTFKYPRIVEGYLIINASLYADLTAGTTTIGLKATLQKNGVAITNADQSSIFVFIAPGTQTKRAGILLTVPRTKFGPGDTLTLLMEVNNSTVATGSIVLFADPANRTDTEKSSGLITRLDTYIPFVPEL